MRSPLSITPACYWLTVGVPTIMRFANPHPTQCNVPTLARLATAHTLAKGGGLILQRSGCVTCGDGESTCRVGGLALKLCQPAL